MKLEMVNNASGFAATIETHYSRNKLNGSSIRTWLHCNWISQKYLDLY